MKRIISFAKKLPEQDVELPTEPQVENLRPEPPQEPVRKGVSLARRIPKEREVPKEKSSAFLLPTKATENEIRGELRKQLSRVADQKREAMDKIPTAKIVGAKITKIGTDKRDPRFSRYLNSLIPVNKQEPSGSHRGDNNPGASCTVSSPLLGPFDSETICENCGTVDCPGHPGFISFGQVSIPNPLDIDRFFACLNSVCHDCGEMLLHEDVYRQYGFDKVPHTQVLSMIADASKGIHCSRNPLKGRDGKYSCSKNPTLDKSELKETGFVKIVISSSTKDDKKKTFEIFPMSTIKRILSRIPDYQARLMGFREGTHPRDLIMSGQIVCPNASRAPVYRGGIVEADQLTKQNDKILKCAQNLANSRNLGTSSGDFNTKDLYQAVSECYIEAPTKKNVSQGTAITNRIQGHDAAMRGSIQGKRNDFCFRGVVNSGAYLDLDQVGVASKWCDRVTKPIKVTDFNIEYVKQMISNKEIKTFEIKPGTRMRINYEKPPEPKVGDLFYRVYQDDDWILYGRQPTLHKVSMMAAKISQNPQENQLTVHLPLAVGPPLNQDNDGDEVSGWPAQKPNVDVEAEYITSTKCNIMSTESNRPMIGLVMNAPTAAFVLTKNGRQKVVDRHLYQEILSIIKCEKNLETLDERLSKFGIDKYSAYGLFSVLFPSEFSYAQKGVVIENGILLKGRLRKAHLGSSPRSIIQDLHKQFGAQSALEFISNAPKLLNKWILEHGFSVGITDFMRLEERDGKVVDLNQETVKIEIAKIMNMVEIYQQEEFADPSTSKIIENKIVDALNVAPVIGLRMANETVTIEKGMGIMTEKGAGTKGNLANVGQMTGLVGQQFISGSRPPCKATNRTRILPNYLSNDPDPSARGFVRNSFFTGLRPQETWATLSGARQNIVVSGISVADAGTANRRVVRACEGQIESNAGGVIGTNGVMFSTIFGSSGIGIDKEVNIDRTGRRENQFFVDIQDVIRKENFRQGWISKDIAKQIPSNVPKSNFRFSAPEERKLVSRPFTKYEKASLVGARAMQLFHNAPPRYEIPNDKTVIQYHKIAMYEFENGLLDDMFILRVHPNGEEERVYARIENINV